MRRLASLGLCCALLLSASAAVAAEEVLEDFIDIPTLQEEVVPAQPSRDEVWIPGYWERDPGKWRWVPGRWEKPPDDSAHWKSGHWALEDMKWRWRPGHWSVGETDWIVEQMIDVPYAFREVIPQRSSESQVWVAGHWDWERGGWFWIPGYYARKPAPDATWVPGHWEPYGQTGRYWWMSGHWRDG